MKNQGQCKWGLLYNEFSILLIQTFTSPEIKIPKGSFIKPITEGNIDEQLFYPQRQNRKSLRTGRF